MFDLSLRVWRQIYDAGVLSRLRFEVLPDGTSIPYTANEVPVDSGGWAGPGKRWRHSMVNGPMFLDFDGILKQKMVVFGGHRLWQGFSPENSMLNNWSNYTTRPLGGYLNDLWVYTRLIDNTTAKGIDLITYEGFWEEKEPLDQCHPDPGITWSSRNDTICDAVWPGVRAGHGIRQIVVCSFFIFLGAAFDPIRNVLWLFGGYSTYFPYLSTNGPGAGPGTSSSSETGFVPYPAYTYYKNDLWYYNLSSGYWAEVNSASQDVPAGRMDFVFLLLGEVLFLHGGYGDNEVFDDTWYYNITTQVWLQKSKFVTPLYPSSCTDDTEYIGNVTNNCTQLDWPKHLERNSVYPFEILDYSDQAFYWPDTTSIQKFDVLPFASDALENLTLSIPANGTPLFPFSASGPLQYQRLFTYSLNASYSLSLLEWCSTVFSEPTRGTVLDGTYGRSSGPIFIAQPRRQRPGWDGCRDRFDGRVDLPNRLQYVQPLPRFGHRGVFNAKHNEIITYGGMAYWREEPPSTTTSYPMRVDNEMWYYSLNQCESNCSLHGTCYFGYCFCDVGYYGIDCSNTSCPGTFCLYNSLHEQQCVHACQAGYNHTDGDVYIEDIAKIPCSGDLKANIYEYF